MAPERLTEWRKQRFSSQGEAARSLGVGRNEWSRYERGLSPIPLKLLWAITGYTLARQPME